MQRRPPSLLIATGLLSLVACSTATLRAQQPADVAAFDNAVPDAKFSAQQIGFFEKEIRPLLIERCWKCHGDKKQQGGLRLDSREAILAGGDLGTAATPGDPAASRIVEVVGYAGDLKMPPTGRLADNEIAVITRWVREGLPWSAADQTPATATSGATAEVAPRSTPWSFQPVIDPTVPEGINPAWCQSPLDRFVLARLEAAGLQPAPAADRATLIRRAKFDLVGLPPTPEEIDAFVADAAPDAFARLVDRLLSSNEYGQRWGRHWLDVARYADSNGQDENLAYVNAYRYRDYVVDAFNGDKPYDQFVREQIAGDLLPGSDDDQSRFARLVATGFLTLGPKMLAEDDPVKMEMDIVDEQVDTVGGAFLGLTLGCARCHDHKFDPISTRDYYALAGIFKSTKTMDNFKVVAQWHERPLATPAEIQRLAEHRAQVDAKKAELAALVKRADAALLADVRKRLADYLVAATELLNASPLESLLQPAADGTPPSLPPGAIIVEAEHFARGNVLVDTTGYGAGIGIILNRGELPNYTEYDVETPAEGWYQIELRYAAAEPRGVHLSFDGKVLKTDAAAATTGSWNPDTQRWTPEGVVRLCAGRVTLRLERTSGPFPHFDRLALIPLSADAAKPANLPPAAEALAHERGLLAPYLSQWAEYLGRARKDSESLWQLWFAYQQQADLATTAFRGKGDAVAKKLLSDGKPESAQVLAARYQAAIDAADQSPQGADKPSDSATEALRQIVADPQGPLRAIPKSTMLYSPPDRDEAARLEQSIAELEKSAPTAPPQAMAVEEGTATDLPIHIRGSHLTLGEVAPRGFPQALAGEAQPLSAISSGRLELANWITDPKQPLASRVMVNRLWRWHFGAGLVRSTDNFGNLGDRPSHPELLDWLAARFIESGWSVKAMHRLVMLSSTYQMSTAYNATAAEADPDNRLLWRMNRRRLEAEAVRDSLLFVGGVLDTSLGGTFLHSKPREYVTSTASVDATNYAINRRSLYLPVVRSALYEAFQAFDFAEPTVIKGDRESTTIASQALFMMNSNVMQDESTHLAARLRLAHPDNPRARVQSLYRMSFGRSPTESETHRAVQFVDRYSASLATQDAGERESIAWQAVCRVVLSSSEFLYVE